MATIRPRTWTNQKGDTQRRYQVDYRDKAGKRRSKQYKLRGDAEAFRKDLERQKARGGIIAVDRGLTVGQLLDQFKAAATLGRGGGDPAAPATQTYYDWAFAHLRSYRPSADAPALEDLPAGELDKPQLLALRDWLMRHESLNRTSGRRVLNIFKAALDEALEREQLAHPFWSNVVIKASRRRLDDDGDDPNAVEIPEHDEVRKILATAEALHRDPREVMVWDRDAGIWRKYYRASGPRGWNNVAKAWRRYYAMIAVNFLAGLRQGEIRALHKADLDLDRRAVKVRRAADCFNNIRAPKTKAGRRTVDLSDDLAGILEDWMGIAPAGQLLFPSEAGTPIGKSALYARGWVRLLELAGTKRYRFHAGRHWFASGQISLGANPKELMEVMGHASVQTTFDLYGHLFEADRGRRLEIANGVAALTRGAGEPPEPGSSDQPEQRIVPFTSA